MKSPLAQLLLVSVLVGIGLWVGVKWFLGTTEDFSANIDVRSVGYLRNSADTVATSAPQSDVATPAPSSTGTPLEALARNTLASGNGQAVDTDDEILQLPLDGDRQTATVDEPVNDEVLEEPDSDADEVVEIEPVVILPSDDELEDEAQQARDDAQRESREADDDTSDDRQKFTLSEEELETRRKARQARLAELGIIRKKAPEPTIAVDVSLDMPDRCAGAAVARVPVGLKFRYETAVMRGESLNVLQSLVALYRECEDGKFLVAENPLGRTDASDTLKQMRVDEVKYFFIQHSVSIDTVQFPEE